MLTVAIAGDFGTDDFGKFGPFRDQFTSRMIVLAFVSAHAAARAPRRTQRREAGEFVVS
jgi:hypothetical protein